MYSIGAELINPDTILSKLWPNPMDVVAQLIATFILFLVIRHFVWDKFKAFLDERATFIETQINDAKEAKRLADESLIDTKNEYAKAAREYQTIVERAKQDALLMKEQLVLNGKQEAEALLNQAKLEVEMERLRLQKDIKQEIVEVALEAARKVIDEELDTNKHRQLVEDFVKEVKH